MEKSIGYWLQRAARLHKARLATALADVGLFPGQEGMLLLLAKGDATTVGDLAEALKVRPPTVSKSLARLAAQNLVERKEHGEDARKTTIGLTKEGAKRARALEALMSDVERDLTEALDGKDERRLRKLLKRVSKSLAPSETTDATDDDDIEE